MKKRCAVIILAAVLAGQMAAQQMAWINPNPTTQLDLGITGGLPSTMLAQVSNGIYYDEWDVVFRAPAELSNYKGINVLTAFGNYSSWYAPAYAPVSPYAIGALASTTPYTIGVSMPIAGFRAAALLGFRFNSVSNNIGADLNMDGTSGTTEQLSATSTEDSAGGTANGINDYTTAWSYKYSDYSVNNSLTFGAGIDLGPVGASLYADLAGQARTIGGKYSYTYTKGSDTNWLDPATVINSYTINYVDTKNGSALLLGEDSSFDTGKVGLLAELPLPNLPITGSLDVSWSTRLMDYFSATNLPMAMSLSASNVGGTAGATLTYTGTDAAGASNAWTVATPPLSSATLSEAALETAAGNYISDYPLDLSACSYGNINAGLSVGIDPTFALGSNIKLVSRAKLGYQFGDELTKIGYSASSSYATTGTGADVTYNMTSSSTSSANTLHNNIDGEFGGVFNFSSANQVLSVGVGAFLLPSAKLTNISNGNDVTSISKTLKTTNGAIADMPATIGTAAAAALVSGTTPYTGTRAYTRTTTHTGGISDNTLGSDFSFPVSAKLSFAKAKLSFVTGYEISTGFSCQIVSDNQTSTAAYSAITLTNAAGASTYTAGPAAGTTTTVGTSSSSVWTANPLSGTLNWMLRWEPMDELTIDISGVSIQNALNFSIFGGAGFNPNALLSSLAISATLHL